MHFFSGKRLLFQQRSSLYNHISRHTCECLSKVKQFKMCKQCEGWKQCKQCSSVNIVNCVQAVYSALIPPSLMVFLSKPSPLIALPCQGLDMSKSLHGFLDALASLGSMLETQSVTQSLMFLRFDKDLMKIWQRFDNCDDHEHCQYYL